MKKFTAGICTASICINVLFLLFFSWYFIVHIGIDKYYYKYFSLKELFLDDIYYLAKVAAYADLNKKLPQRTAYTVFVGDSLIEQFQVSEHFPGKSVLNRGIGQDTTNGILKRLDRTINNIRMASVYVMVGHNDLQYRTVDETCRNIEKILATVQAKKKFFLSIPPCAEPKYNEAIKRVNEKMYQSSLEKKFIYVDCYRLFTEQDGAMARRFFYDRTHLNVAGYDKIANVIRQTGGL